MLTCKENDKLRCTKLCDHVKYLINFLDTLLKHEFQALIQYKKFLCKDRPEMKRYAEFLLYILHFHSIPWCIWLNHSH